MRKALLFISFLFISAGAVLAQTDTPPGETIFVELNLTPSGVVAVDSTGNRWVYDFNQDKFVPGDLTDDTEGRFIERGAMEQETDVELRCTELKTVKRFADKVLVGFDEYVDGDILAYNRVNVKGWVKGDIKSVNGRVTVYPYARVDGDIEAPEIEVKDEGEVLGHEIIRTTPLDLEDLYSTFSMDGVIVIIILLAFFLLVAFLYHTLMPRQLANVAHCIINNRVKTTFLGFILLFAMPVLMVLVAITFVGIILVPVIPILYVFAMVMGMTVVGNKLGQKISVKFLGGEKQPVFMSMLGIFVLTFPWIISMIFWGMGNTVGYTFGGIFLGIGSISVFYPIFSGLGGILLTRFGFQIHSNWKNRQRKADPTKTPAPPPIPNAPNSFNSDEQNNQFATKVKPDLPKPPNGGRSDNL